MAQIVISSSFRLETGMPSGADNKATVDSFLKAILQSGILERDELQASLKAIPKEKRDTAKSIADQLVRNGKLSTFQAAKLLRGNYQGLILGPYQVLAPIGKGGMGTVYLARDSKTKRLLAIKILSPKRAKQEERTLVRFQREMEISKRLNHPHIALTFDSGESKGVYFIAMEYIPGKTLSKNIIEKGPLKVQRAARLFLEVVSGLDHAHTQGVIHRDLKPSNIMITPNGHAKILDLGFALMEGEVSVAREIIGGQGIVVGSMDWIAPEQVKDAVGVDARADIYALGCTMYFAMTGKLPFPGGTPKEKMIRHQTEQPPPITKLNPSLPEGFAAIIQKMMAKKPADRYANAKEIRDTLIRWVGKEPNLPMDKKEDKAFEQAVHDLETARVAPEIVERPILEVPSPKQKNSSPSSLVRNPMILWIGGGILGVGVIGLIIFGLILLLN